MTHQLQMAILLGGGGAAAL